VNYTDVMIDLETVGTAPGSGIISIGAVAFAPGVAELDWPCYYSGPISRRSCRFIGLTDDQATLDWWNRQAPEARMVFNAASDEQTVRAVHIINALMQFSTWFRAQGANLEANLEVWGNGSDFDNVLLQCAMKKADVDAPWPFYMNRCFRTMKTQFPVPEPTFKGVRHNALQDALHQTRWLQRIWDNTRLLDQKVSLSDATGCSTEPEHA